MLRIRIPFRRGCVAVTTKNDEDKLEELDSRRTTFNEVLITAVLFGLVVNIVSDAISNASAEYASIITTASIILVFLLLGYVFWTHLGKFTRIKQTMRTAYIWDSEAGEILQRDTGYLPQRALRTLYESLSEDSRRKAQDILRTNPKDIVGGTSTVIQPLQEAAFFMVFERLSQIDPSTARSIGSEVPEDSVLLSDTKSLHSLMHSKAQFEYRRSPEGTGRFVFSWFKGIAGKLTVGYRLTKADWYEDKPENQMVLDPFYLEEFANVIIEIAKMYPKLMPEFFPNRELPDLTVEKSGPLIRADCEISIDSKNDWDKMMATTEGKKLNKDLMDFHQNIDLIFVNYEEEV